MFKTLARAISPFSVKKESSSPSVDDGSVKDFENYYWDLKDVNLSSTLFFFYSQYNPSKVDAVDRIVQEYKGEEILMLQEICGRYNLSQADMQKFVNRGRKSEQSRKSISMQRKEPLAGLGYVANDNDFRFDEFDSQSTDSKSKSVDNSTISTKVSADPNASKRPAPPPPPPQQRQNQPPPPTRPLPSAPPPPTSRPKPPFADQIQSLPRSSIIEHHEQEPQQRERSRMKEPGLPAYTSQSANVAETFEQRDSVVQPNASPARKASPTIAKNQAQQRFLDLAKRAKSPAAHSETIAVGGNKVAIPPKPPAPPKPKARAESSDQASMHSSDNPENNDTALFFFPQPQTMKAAVVAMPSHPRHGHSSNADDDDDDDTRTNNSDLTRDDASVNVRSTTSANHHDQPSSSSADSIIMQLRSELEQARQDTKDMFAKLTELMQQQNQTRDPPQPPSTRNDDHISETSSEAKFEASPPPAEDLGSKTLARVHQELKAVQHELRRVTEQMNDLIADRRDLLNLLKSVAVAQVHGKGVLESYVSQYGKHSIAIAPESV
jgi:hypothetical protein